MLCIAAERKGLIRQIIRLLCIQTGERAVQTLLPILMEREPPCRQLCFCGKWAKSEDCGYGSIILEYYQTGGDNSSTVSPVSAEVQAYESLICK